MSQNYTLEWATYNVHFIARGGSGTMSDQVFTYNTAQALTANAFTPPPGCQNFAGWNTKADGSGTGNPATLGFYKYTGDAIPANKAYYVQ